MKEIIQQTRYNAIIFLSFFCTKISFAEASQPNFLIELDQNKISIEKTKDPESLSKKIKQQEKRIQTLENAVRELQDKIFQTHEHNLKTKVITTREEISTWDCYIKDAFGKIFSGKGETKLEASGHALKKCGGGISCKEENLKCSSEKQIKEKIYPSGNTQVIEKPHKKIKWTCLMQDNFQETFTGEGQSEAEAQAKTLKACGGGRFCTEENMKCSHN